MFFFQIIFRQFRQNYLASAAVVYLRIIILCIQSSRNHRLRHIRPTLDLIKFGYMLQCVHSAIVFNDNFNFNYYNDDEMHVRRKPEKTRKLI